MGLATALHWPHPVLPDTSAFQAAKELPDLLAAARLLSSGTKIASNQVNSPAEKRLRLILLLAQSFFFCHCNNSEDYHNLLGLLQEVLSVLNYPD